MIPVGPWAPDMPDLQAAGSTEAFNVLPAARSYRPFPSFAQLSAPGAPLSERCQGAIFARKSDGTGAVFAGSATKLWRLDGTAWTDASRTIGGPYACPADGMWSFVQFGPSVYASNGADAMQRFNIDSDANFSANTGSPPAASYQCVAGDFLITANQAAARQRVQWSAINDPTASWAASQVTQASSQDLPDGGWIQGILGLEYQCVIFQEFAIRRAVYEGVPNIFRFSLVTQNLGCTIPGSLAQHRDLMFFCDRSGFYMLQGGAAITPIGEQRVNRYFWDESGFGAGVDQGSLPRVTSAIDPVNEVYVLAYPRAATGMGRPDQWLAYHWPTDRWSHGDFGGQALEMVFSGATQSALTLEQLDNVSGSLDALPFSLDSAVWSGIGHRLVGGFDVNGNLGYFNGPALAATVDTMEAAPGNGRLVRLRSARPLVDGGGLEAGTASLRLGVRSRQMDSWGFAGPAVAVNALGTCPFNAVARYIRGRITMPAGAAWQHILGIDDLDVRPEGRF